MKLKGQPNQVVQKRVKKGGKWKVVPIFMFDENGDVEIDQTKYSATDLSKIVHMFGSNSEHTDDQIREMAKEKKIKSWHVKSIETLKEELNL